MSTDAIGAGFIAGADGDIVTARHLVLGTETDIIFPSGEVVHARVIKSDSLTDIAILRTDVPKQAVDGSPLRLSRRPLVPGETVMAFGSPFGLTRSVSLGIVSAVDRKPTPSMELDRLIDHSTDLIQTDAAVNPGNSGGPLVDSAGEVIGIMIAMLPAANRIGFAVPARRIESLLGNN